MVSRRRDAIGVAIAVRLLGCCVALLPHSSNVSRHAQRAACQTIDYRSAMLSQQYKTTARAAHPPSTSAFVSRDDLRNGAFCSLTCRTKRAQTNGTKTGRSTLACFKALASRQISRKAARATHSCTQHPYVCAGIAIVPPPQRTHEFLSCAGRKAASTTSTTRLLTLQQRAKPCSTPSHRNRRD